MLTLRRLKADELAIIIPSLQLVDRTFGALQLGTKTYYTIEQEWNPSEEFPAGEPSNSCIPPGVYKLVWRRSPAKGLRLHFVNEELGVFLEKQGCTEPWHRFSCMFHAANYVRNVTGCIGPGRNIADFKGNEGWGVSSSNAALNDIEAFVNAYKLTEIRIL